MSKEKSYLKIGIKTIIIFIALYVFIKVLDFLGSILGFEVFIQISKFLSLNLLVLILMIIIAMIAQILIKQKKPFNFAYPILMAIPIVYMIKLIALLLVVIAMSVSTDLTNLVIGVDLINPFIFWLIIIFGYYKIFTNKKNFDKFKDEVKEELKAEIKAELKEENEEKSKMKNEIKEELKQETKKINNEDKKK